jgi:hypothetical protein
MPIEQTGEPTFAQETKRVLRLGDARKVASSFAIWAGKLAMLHVKRD